MIDSNSGMIKNSSDLPDRTGCVGIFTVLIGFVVGGVSGFIFGLISTGWELSLMVMAGTCLSAMICPLIALIGAGIARAISKPIWLGALIGALLYPITIGALWIISSF